MLEFGQWCLASRPEDGPGDDEASCGWTRLMRFATPSGQLAFTHTGYDTDIRRSLCTIHVPAAVL